MGIVYWSPLSIFVPLNKELESGGGGGGAKIYVLVLLVGGGFENSTCFKRGATKKYYNCTVSPHSPCTINNERSLNGLNIFNCSLCVEKISIASNSTN